MDAPVDLLESGVRRRAGVIRWMDRWVDLVLLFLAMAAVPLLLVETGAPDDADAGLVVRASWFIWGAFTGNVVARLALSLDRKAALRWLAPDLVLVIGQPLLSIGERRATPVLALVPLAAVGFRAMLKGRLLRRTGGQLRNHPLRLLLVAVPFVWVLGAALVFRFEREAGTITSFGDGLWWGAVTLATVGYGDISPKSTPGRYVAVFTMVVGIGMFSVITAQLAERLLAQRRELGRREVLESGHTLIIGWSAAVLTIVGELLVANRSRRGASIVILADRATEDMYDDLRSHLPDLDRSGTTVVCRSGSPTDPPDLARCRPDLARSIIVVAPDHDDTGTARTLLALLHAEVPIPGIPIVAEIGDAAIAASIEHALPGRVMIVNPVGFVARTAAQACLSAGVGLTYDELLTFSGSALYVQAVPGTVGEPFWTLAPRFIDACPVGVQRGDGTVDLCPPAGTVVGAADELVLVARDDSQVTFGGAPPAGTSPPAGVLGRDDDHGLAPLHAVVLGWNEFGPKVVEELDGFLTPGSRLTVAIDPGMPGPSGDDVGTLVNAELAWHEAPGAAFADLVDLIAQERADHVMVLCGRGGLDAREADARALLTALQVRRAIDQHGHDTTLVTELRDQRDVALAPPANAGEFIVSDKLVSLLMAQLSEDRALDQVFRDLLDPQGAEIYAKPAAWFGIGDAGTVRTFGDLVRAGVVRQDCVIGYRVRRLSASAADGFGLVVNPPSSAPVELAPDDEVIVVSEGAA